MSKSLELFQTYGTLLHISSNQNRILTQLTIEVHIPKEKVET